MRMQARRERIDELEKWAAAKKAAWGETVKQIWTQLPPAEVEALMTAHAADRAGRPLTEQELAARQAYATLLKQEHEKSSPRLAWGLELAPEITFEIAHRIVISQISDKDLQLLLSGGRRLERGEPLTESEEAVGRACAPRIQHLLELAGIPDEFFGGSECS